MGHKTFWVLADHLSRNRIAVLRYDDRGVGQSEGRFEGATSYDFANDASAAIDFLSSVNSLSKSKMGIIGHSEGGLIAPVVATQNKQVDFILMLAGPSKSGRFVSENQMKTILLSNGLSEQTAVAGSMITSALNETVLNNEPLSKARLSEKLSETYINQWQKLPKESQQELKSLGGGSLPAHRINMLTSQWYKVFLRHEPVEYLSTLDIPVYALFAEKDVQVNANDHYPAMQNMLNRNQHSKAHILPEHNHLFQRSKTGAMSEYQKIEETLSEQVLSEIKQWIISIT